MSRKEKSKVNGTVGKLVRLAVFAVAVGIAVFALYQYNLAAKREAAYQEALTAQENGDYTTAIALFQELGEYKDSQKQLEETEFARKFVNSDTFKSLETMVHDSFSGIGGQMKFQYDVKSHAVIVSVIMPENNTTDELNAEDIEPAVLASWGSTCDALDYPYREWL